MFVVLYHVMLSIFIHS